MRTDKQMTDSTLHARQRAKNLRTGWIVGSIALGFLVGFLVRVFSTQ